MDSIFAPWRMDWVTRKDTNDEFDGCVFCGMRATDEDRRHRIVARSERAYVLLNRSPYTPGHLLVLPHSHAADVTEVDETELLSLVRLLRRSVEVIRRTLNPEGFNVGMNIGKAGGASIQDHLHVHVVPRWHGDTTFMPTTANTKIIAEALDETYDRLRDGFAEMDGVETTDGDGAAVL